MESVIVKNPKILGGTAVFRGTRVPLQLLLDSLERGHTLEEFLAGYPTVSREMAIAASALNLTVHHLQSSRFRGGRIDRSRIF